MKYLRQLAVLLLSLSMALIGQAKIGTEFQMQLGNASNASADPTNHSHYLIQRAQYAMDYADYLGTANWVSWNLTTEDVGSSGRSSFGVDTSLPSGFYQVLTTDYAYAVNGLDRGHMCPSADRTVTSTDNKAVFLMSNMVPQAPDNNQGIWNNFESYCRTLASQGNELLITSGPTGYLNGKILSGVVAVPDNVWKIVVVVPLGTGTALERINADTRVIAIKVPNIQGIRTTPWQNYITNVAQLELDTGLRFFTALPEALANTLRAKIDGGSTGGGGDTTATVPTITSGPASMTVALGANATFSVAATSNAGSLSYQWFKDGNEINGATSSFFAITGVTNADAGSYSVMVTNNIGSVTSNAATLTVATETTADAAITWDFGTTTAMASPLSTTVPTGLSVADVIRGNEAANNLNTNPAITTEASTSSFVTASYPAGISPSKAYNIRGAGRGGALNKASGGSLYFETTVTADANTLATMSGIGFSARSTGTGPTRVTVCSVAGPTIIDLATVTEAADSKWYYLRPGVPTTVIEPGTSLTLRIYGWNGTGNTTNPCWRIDDLRLAISAVSIIPAITGQPLDVSTSVGGTANFSVTATSPGTRTYQWRKDGTPISGTPSALTADLALSNLGAADIGAYDCVVSNSYGRSQTSTAANLSVTQSYDAWAAATALPAGRNGQTDDADGDGVQNFVEYALGLNPLVPDSQLLPACVLSSGQVSLDFSHPKTSTGFAFVVETSTDLASWQQLTPSVMSSTTTTETLSVSVPSDAPRRFFRLVLGGARTVPVGYTRISLAAAATTAFSPVLDDVQSPLAGIRSGTVDTLAASTVGNLGGSWTGNLANPAAPWALRFTSGAAAGRQFDVKSNTATTVTVAGADLTTLGIVPGADRFELIPLETLGTLFGTTTLQGGTSSATADIVQLRSGATWIAFYYDTAFGHWRRTVGIASNCDNTIVRPGSGLTIQRRGTTLPLVLTGRVLATPFRTAVAKAGSTVVSLGYPADTTLAGLSLQTLLPGWRTGTADQVFLHNGSAWVGYHHNGSAWVRSSDSAAANTLPLGGTTSLLIQRSGATAGTVDLVRNLSF